MFHVKHEAWADDARAAGLSLTNAQLEALSRYHDHVLALAVPRGYIATSDANRLWRRHILDALRAAPEVPTEASLADLGSGAGIPGLPLAIVTPNQVTLVEVRRGRAAFLESAIDVVGLSNVRVALGPVEGLSERYDVCLARAFAPVGKTWRLAEPRLEPRGSLIYWAGASFDTGELDPLGVTWRVSEHADLADSGPLVIMTRQ